MASGTQQRIWQLPCFRRVRDDQVGLLESEAIKATFSNARRFNDIDTAPGILDGALFTSRSLACFHPFVAFP